MFEWINKSLYNKLLVCFVGLGLIALTIIGILTFRISRQALEHSIETSLLNLSVAKANEMDGFLMSIAKIPSIMASSIEADQTKDEALIKERLRRILISNPDIYGTAAVFKPYTFYANRRSFTPYWWYDKGSPNYISSVPDDYIYWERLWYTVPRDTGKHFWSPAYYDEGAGETLMITSSAPFYNNDGEFTGVATIDISLDHLSQIIREVALSEKFESKGHAVLISKKGMILAIDDPKLVVDKLIDVLQTDVYKVIDGRLKIIAKKMVDGQQGVERLTDPFGGKEEVFAVYATLSNTGWSVVIFAPAKVMLKELTALRRIFVIVTVIIIFAVAAVVWLVARSITRPIKNLTEIARDVSGGNLSVGLKIESKDEIGVLSGAFNKMTEHLRNLIDTLEERVAARTHGLETVAILSGQLNAILDFEQVLQVLVDQVKAHFDYYHVHIYMLENLTSPENKGQKLLMRAGAGEVGEQMKSQADYIPLTAETSIVARAACTGKTVKMDNVSEIKDWQPNPLLPNIQSEMAVPIINEDKIVGVLDVLSDKTSGFDEGDANLLRSLANHVTVALTNARLFEEAKKRAMELAKARDDAEAANSAKSIFLANMSHELRTPLNSILGFSQIMRKDPETLETQWENLDIINRSGEHLLALINDVLDIAKIEAGRIVLEPENLDLGELIMDVTDMMRSRMEKKNLQLSLDQSSDYPRYIYADSAKMRQIFVNIIGNAVKYTEKGTITLRLKTKPDFQEHHVLLFCEVEDTGIGITEEDQKQIFNPFEQVIKYADVKGTGLGLSITRQYIELMGGEISVTSEPGKGSVFRFEIPIQTVSSEEIKKAKPSLGPIIGLAPGQPVYRILIVEDQLENRLLLKKLLEPVGFDLREAVNGEEAVTVFKEWKPHFIWMDRRMPIMDGLTATRHIKALPEGQETIIAALTASVFKEQRNEILAGGFDDFISKPFQQDEIFEVMTRHLGVKFIYEEKVAKKETVSLSLDEVFSPEKLAQFPEQLLNDLQSAAHVLNIKRTNELVEQIRSHNSNVADALAKLAGEFRFEEILDRISDK